MFLTNNQADKMNFLSGLIVIYNRMNNSHTSISGREDRSKTIQTIFLLGFLLYGFTVTAEKINCDVPVCSTESYRSKTNTLTAGQDTVVFRFAPGAVCSGPITKEMQPLLIRLPAPSDNTNFQSNRVT